MTRRKKILAWLMILILSVASFVQPLFAGTAEEQEITFRITAGAGKISVKDSGYNILEVQGDSPEEKTGIFERGEKLQVQITPKEGWDLYGMQPGSVSAGSMGRSENSRYHVG